MAEMADNKNISFETALTRLEEIVKELENGSAELDKSLDMFEEGIKLVKLCTYKLDDAERRISILTKNGEGSYDEKPFGSDQ
jgi:exodeoxyribonuclease VII small subunit